MAATLPTAWRERHGLSGGPSRRISIARAGIGALERQQAGVGANDALGDAAGRSGVRTLLTGEVAAAPVGGERSSWHTNLPAASSKILLEGSLDGVGFATELGIARRRVNDHGVLSPAGDALCDQFAGIEDPIACRRCGRGRRRAALREAFRALAVADLDVIRYEPGAQDRGATRAC